MDTPPEAGDGPRGGDVVGEIPRVQAALVDDRAADVGHRDHAHARGGQQEGERSADLAEALDDHPAAGDGQLQLGQRGPHAGHHPRRGGAGVGLGATDREGLAGDRRGEQRPVDHRERVHQPGHDPAVGVDVGRRDVPVGTEQGRDLVRVAAGEPLQLADAQPGGVAAHAALGAPEGDVEHRGLQRHGRGQRGDLVGVDVGVEPDAALAGPAGGVVVDPPPQEDLDGAVVHPDRDRHLEDALRATQHPVHVGADPAQLGGVVEVRQHGLPGVRTWGWRHLPAARLLGSLGSPEPFYTR
jgi:hypothetical protein